MYPQFKKGRRNEIQSYLCCVSTDYLFLLSSPRAGCPRERLCPQRQRESLICSEGSDTGSGCYASKHHDKCANQCDCYSGTYSWRTNEIPSAVCDRKSNEISGTSDQLPRLYAADGTCSISRPKLISGAIDIIPASRSPRRPRQHTLAAAGASPTSSAIRYVRPGA